MNKISVYTILYKDLQFYEDIIKNLYDVVDEFIIIDGPYSYAIDVLKKLNLFYDEDNKPNKLNELIHKYPKIKYKYVICNTEEEKRMIGYNMCSNNLVLLVDTDEFLTIDTHKLNHFIQSNKFVCCANIYNMCDYNVHYNKLTEKYILFKKNKITALEHLNYTWLIGCKQTEKNISYMCFNPFGLIYHLTLNRNKENNIIKFIFYVLLYRKTNHQQYNLIDNYDNDKLLNDITPNEFLNIFVHSKKNFINIPDDVSCLSLINNVPYLTKYNKNLLDFEINKEQKCLLNVPVFFRVHKKNILSFENVIDIFIKINYLYINSPPIEKSYTNLTHIEINETTSKYIYVELRCTKTYNGNIFTIKVD